MNFKIFLLLVSLCFLFCSCNKEKQNEPEPIFDTTTVQEKLPPMPEAELIKLFQTADDIDIQYNAGYSMNINGKGGAQQQIMFMSPDAAERVPCDELCLMFIKSQGEQIAYLNAYMGEGCAYYVFYENNERKYVNAMTNNGIQFYKNILAQYKTAPKPQ